MGAKRIWSRREARPLEHGAGDTDDSKIQVEPVQYLLGQWWALKKTKKQQTKQKQHHNIKATLPSPQPAASRSSKFYNTACLQLLLNKIQDTPLLLFSFIVQYRTQVR